MSDMAKDLLQSDGWERFQRALGRRTHRVDGVLAIEMPLPFGLRYLYAPRSGASGKLRVDSGELLGAVRTARAVFFRVEEGSQLSTINYQLSTPRVLRRAVEPEWTWRTSLEGSDEERLAAMHEKHRYNVRLAERRGVRVSQCPSESVNQEQVGVLWSLLQDTAKRQGIATHPRSYYETMLKTLAKRRTQNAERKTEDTDCLLYLAERESGPLVTAIVVYHGDTATYLHGGSSHEHRALMAPHLLHWRAMCDAKAAGLTWYDWGGVAAPETVGHENCRTLEQTNVLQSSSWSGMTRFKQGFGGETVQHPPMRDLVFRPRWYRALSFLARLRN